MHSYEERIRAVELYYRYGKKASVVVRELGYPSTKQLGCWVRIYEDTGDLPRDLKPRERYSRAQKIAAVEHYLRHGGCLSFTRRAIGYPSNEVLKSWIQEFYPNARPWSFAQAQTSASARKRELRPSGNSVRDMEPRVKLHKA